MLHPPVNVERFQPAKPEDFFLIVTELVPHKRVDLALQAAQRAGKHVKVVGSGPDRQRLKATSETDTAEFLGRASDSELNGLYSRAGADRAQHSRVGSAWSKPTRRGGRCLR